MSRDVLIEVACRFVEQFDNRYGMLTDRSDVRRIRDAADEDSLFAVVASVFGEKLDSALVDAAYGAMDYIAYVDETWGLEMELNKNRTLETEGFHIAVDGHKDSAI